MPADKLYLYRTDDAERDSEVTGTGGDIVFPHHVRGWSDVLDCRVEPYTEQSLTENCDLAHHVRKRYILVRASQVAQQSPTG